MQDFLSFFYSLDDEAGVVATRLGRILVILLVAWLLQHLASRLIRAFRRVMARRMTAPEELRRIDTVGTAFRYLATVVVVLVAGMLVLNELGISIAPILATAGVAGVAIGFGAQSLIRDYFTGLFLLIEDQVREGDVVEIAGKGGLVEEVTLRYVRLRDVEGHVHYVPNGEIKIVTNRTRGYATAVVEVGVAYRESIGRALGVMREIGAAMRADPKWKDRLVEDVEIIGLERLDASAVALRCRLKVMPPIEQWNVRREFLTRLKEAYDQAGIEIPFPQLAVHTAQHQNKGE